MISGQVDRLAVTPDRVTVLDYKTDWSLRYSIGASTSELTVSDYRTWNDDII